MTDWQTTYKTNYEQRLRDQYDPATGERLMVKYGGAIDLGTLFVMPKEMPKIKFEVWKDDRVPLGAVHPNIDTPTASAKRTLTK